MDKEIAKDIIKTIGTLSEECEDICTEVNNLADKLDILYANVKSFIQEIELAEDDRAEEE